MKETLTLEEAFQVVIKLFKTEREKREKAERLIDWIATHEATSTEYKSMAKAFLDSHIESQKDNE